MSKIQQKIVIDSCDWGPAVAKTILHFPTKQTIEYAKNFFLNIVVTEKKESFDWPTYMKLGKQGVKEHIIVTKPIQVKNSYVSDEYGNQINQDSEYLTVEINYNPNSANPFCFDMKTFLNTICNPYELHFETPEHLDINPQISFDDALIPSIENVDLTGVYQGKNKQVLHYASFEPKNKNNVKKHPLMIWLHGAGEGGVDPRITILGNKVTALYQEEFQSIMDGCYVLTPQTDYFWLCWNEKKETSNNPGVDSVYIDTLLELIHHYIDEHEEIDRNRVYLSGCSNGGFMTMCVLLNDPDTFAAAIPICEAYHDSGIDDIRLNKMKKVPIWFVYSKDDNLVDPDVYERPTMARLKSLGSEVHCSEYEHVIDLTNTYFTAEGKPYQYSGHWSWIYYFNNECKDGEQSIFEWIASKHR